MSHYFVSNMGKPASSKVCRVKQSTNKYKKRRGFTGTKKKLVVNSGDVNSFVNIENKENLSFTPPPQDCVNNVNNVTPVKETPTSSSANKVEYISALTPKDADKISGYRLVDTTILSCVIGELLCPICQQDKLTLKDCLSKKQELANLLLIRCSSCIYKKEFFTSERCGRGFDVNKRTAYTIRVLGHGHSGIEKFTHLMNMPKPMTKNNYNKIIKQMATVTKEIAEQTMSDAANDFLVEPEILSDVVVSCDGTWQKHGFQSLNGIFAVLSVEW